MKKDYKDTFYASCSQGLESFVIEELNNLNVEWQKETQGGVLFKTTKKVAMHFLLTSRIASRVYLQVHRFQFQNEKEIYHQSLKFPWTKIFDLEQTFKIKPLIDRKVINNFRNSIILSQFLKDAIVDNFRKKYNQRPDVNKDNADMSFLLHIEGARGNLNHWGTVYLDLCGTPLSNRGYRMPGQPAPLRENLAAAIVLASKWNPAEETFIDCMCGTGTILIEAALIKKKILPSYMQLRRVVKEKRTIYAFQDHVWFKNDQKLELWFRRFAESTVKTSEEILDDDSLEELPIIGVDQSDRAISSSSQHILKAGLDSLILLKKGNALEYEPKESYPTGVVVANPPYGKRLQHEGEGELRDLYHDLGETFKNKFKGYRAYILTPDPALRKAIALQTSARIPMFNGNIECRLLKYELY